MIRRWCYIVVMAWWCCVYAAAFGTTPVQPMRSTSAYITQGTSAYGRCAEIGASAPAPLASRPLSPARHRGGSGIYRPVVSPVSTAAYQAHALRPAVAVSSTAAASCGGSAPAPSGGPRRVYQPGVSEDRGDGYYWDEEEEDWLPIPGGGSGSNIAGLDPGTYVGETCLFGGERYTWNGEEWVITANEINMPIGSGTVVLVLLMAVYALLIFYRHTKQTK